jgi:hypothetical protein
MMNFNILSYCEDETKELFQYNLFMMNNRLNYEQETT